MGLQASKEENSVELKLAVDRIKSCFENHRSNVYSIDSAIKAQSDSVQLLSSMIPDHGGRQTSECEQPRNGPLEITRNLLANIQNTLIHQVGALNESFGILDNCIREVSARYSTESGSHAYADRRTLGSAQTRTHIGRFDKITHESEVCRHAMEVGSSNAEDGDRNIEDSVRALRSENEAIISNNNELQMKLRETDEIIRSFQDENNRQSNEIESLKRNVKNKTEETGQAKKQREELDKKCAYLEAENKKLNGEVDGYRRDASTRHSLENTIGRLHNTVDKQNRRIHDLEEEKRKVKERKMIVPVQLFYQRKDELMTLVVNELSLMLDSQLQTKNIQLEIVRCENISRIQPDKPILVLCINSSRLGTDASTAIEGVQKSGRTALLIFHHKNIHALPNQPSDRMLTSSEFKQLGGIIDLAFLTGRGIYPCDMNNIAISVIENFIQRNISGK